MIIYKDIYLLSLYRICETPESVLNPTVLYYTLGIYFHLGSFSLLFILPRYRVQDIGFYSSYPDTWFKKQDSTLHPTQIQDSTLYPTQIQGSRYRILLFILPRYRILLFILPRCRILLFILPRYKVQLFILPRYRV